MGADRLPSLFRMREPRWLDTEIRRFRVCEMGMLSLIPDDDDDEVVDGVGPPPPPFE